jgi:hypothetical protein
MNIFVTSECPEQSAIVLPDSHIRKMPIECCQMLAYISSPWIHNYGTLSKKDGEPYITRKNSPHLNHPCTLWAAKSVHNAQWLLYHGFMLCEEYLRRYGKQIACYETLLVAERLLPPGNLNNTTPFVRAMPDRFKNDKRIDTFTAYKRCLAAKPWIQNDYKKLPERKPDWLS